MLKRLNVSRALLAVVCLTMTAIAGNVQPQEIVNPVLFYYEEPAIDGGTDSLLTTKVTFDPLPKYGVQTGLTIEHYALFDTDSGMTVEIRGEAVERVMLDMPQYATLWPGPISRGDTLVAKFLLTPEQVGIIPLSLIIYDNIELVPNKSVRVGVMGDISFILDAEGRTFGLASPAVSKRNATVLGPAEHLLTADRIFRVEPRYPQPDLRWLSLEGRPNYNPEEEIFALEVRVSPMDDRPAFRRISCRVSPYRDFEYGIAWQVSHSNEFRVTALDSCRLGTVKADSVYEFSFLAELVTPGLGSMVINFVTPNPDFGIEGALFSNRPSVVGADLMLVFGIDEDLTPVLITDAPIKTFLKAAREAGIDPVMIDQRFAFVQKHWRDDYEFHTIQGERFNFVMVHQKP